MKLTDYIKKEEQKQEAETPEEEPHEIEYTIHKPKKSAPKSRRAGNVKTLLDADYTTRDNNVIIRLFYKENGKRTIKEINNFEPYFYAAPYDLEELKNEVKNLDKIIRTETLEMTDLNKKIKVLKLFVNHPKNVPEARVQVKNLESCMEVREADIPFTRRYIIDSGLVPMENAEEADLNVCAFDIEAYNPHGDCRSERDPILMISYADSMGMEKVLSYKTETNKNLIKNLNLGPDVFEFLNNEKEVIQRFIELIKEREIDIITSYNGDNFDFPYIRERAEKYDIKLDIGIDGSEVRSERRGMNMGAKVKGRPHVDMFPVCKQAFNFPRYTLEDVYEGMFGEEKQDIEGVDIHKYWDSTNPNKFKKLLIYSLSDVVATLRIAETMLPLQYELSRTVRETIYEGSRMGSGQRVEQLLIENAYEKKILVPNKPPDSVAKARSRGSYVGGFVVDPKRGIHDNIVLFDFRSLYPSVIISHNIDPSTMNCECCQEDNEQHVSPTGQWFCKNKKGFIPEILNGLIEKRVAIKKKLKAEKDENKKKLLDVQQQAIKLIANSFYGYLAFARARWYSKECAESTTAWGRKYIHKAVSEAEKFGFEVVYGDTDSVFVIQKQEKNKDKIKNNSFEFLKKINKQLPEAMELEFEGFYPRGVFITKKRYALIGEDEKLTVKGLETRRRDWANVAKETQQAVLNAILKDKDPAAAADAVKQIVENIKSGNVEMDDLVINTRLTKSIKDYVSTGPHVEAAKKAMSHGIDIKEGDVVPYIITKGEKKGLSISEKAVVYDFVEEGDYDADYYVNNQILPAVMRILESLGYSEDELKGLGKQMTLF